MNRERAGGAPWVLLRGLLRDARHWGGFVDALQAAYPDARIETIDFPGNGTLHAECSLGTVGAMAEHCRGTLRARGLAPPYRVLALSLGAMVAVDWAERYPREFAAGVLVNTSLRPHARFWERLRPRVWPTVLRRALRPTGARAAESAILALTSACPHRHAVLDDWTHWHEQQPVSRRNAVRQLRAAAGFVAAPTAPRVPLLVLAGGGDALVHPNCSRRLARAWKVELREHPSAGHDLPLDDGGWVIEQLREWRPAARGR